jgi:NAD(P)-dependent dehydrogenase (short-subunit alcohol dehydrogenase family)
MSFEGKAVLVTGAANGLGKAIAERFAALRAQVMIADIDGEGASQVAKAIGDQARARRCDVGEAAEVESAVQATVDAFGGLDILVNNAGIELFGSLVEFDLQDYARITATNFDSVFYGIKFGAPRIIERGGGSIISTASIGGLNAVPLFGAYCATKAAVISLTKTAALELRPQRVRVNAVCPGFIRTRMAEATIPTFEALGVSVDALLEAKQGGWGAPDDIAKIVTHLASDDAGFVSGVAYVVDNGLSSSLL